MRTPLIAVLLALVPACLAGEITGVGDDDPSNAVCGDGAIEGTEQCDDSNAASGDGCSSTCQNETATPRVTATVDKPTVTTELAKTETVTVSLTSAGGFAGDVTVTARLVDGGDVALPNITVTGPTTVSLTANGIGTAAYQIQIPMNATGTALTGTLKVGLASSAGSQDLSSVVTVNNIYTVDYATGTGVATANHMNTANTPSLSVKRGAILRFHNSDTIDHIIHGGGVYPHEGTTVGVNGLPGRNYDIDTIGIAPGSTGTLGCHTHGTASYSTYSVE